MLEPHQVYMLARDQAFFKALFFSGDRAADLALVKTQEILCFPDNTGFLFNHLWSKTLRQGDQNVFALKRAVNKLICPVLGIEVYIKICNLLVIDVTKGFLFRSLSKEKCITADKFNSSAAQSRLDEYVKQLASHFKPERRLTLHGFRSGAAVSLALSKASLHEIMDHVGWKTPALHYIKLKELKEVLNPAGPAAAALDVYTKWNELQEFSQAFSGL